ncbi:hypothetical protein V8E51_007463 [Hyaloscypha variabilis]
MDITPITTLLQGLTCGSTLTPSDEDLAQRIFNKFKDRYLELIKDPNIGRPSANVDETIKVFERDLGGDLTYYYEVLPRHILEKMGFRVSLLMQDFLVTNKVNWAVLLEEHMLAVLTYHLARNQIDLSGTKESFEKSGERTFHNFSFLSDDQRVRAARAELKLVPVALSQKTTVVAASRCGTAWAKKLHGEFDQSVKKLNETRLPDYEAITTIGEEQGKLATAFARVAKLGNSHYFFQAMISNGSVVAHFFETFSMAVQGLHPEAKAFLEVIRSLKVSTLDEVKAHNIHAKIWVTVADYLQIAEKELLSKSKEDFFDARIWELIQDIKRKESIPVSICVAKKVLIQAGLQFIHRQSIHQDIDSLVQFWLTYENVHEGNGVWVHNRDTKRVRLVWDSYASNYLFLEKSFARETLQRARIPLLQIGLNNVDTKGIVSKKGRELGVLLCNSTKGHAALLHRAGEKAITEEIIREMIANALQQSSAMLGAIDWNKKKVQAFFRAAQFAFMEKV